MSKIGRPVPLLMISSKFLMLKNIEMAYGKEVSKPMVTVPMMAIGITLSAPCTSSAKCEAESRQEGNTSRLPSRVVFKCDENKVCSVEMIPSTGQNGDGNNSEGK